SRRHARPTALDPWPTKGGAQAEQNERRCECRVRRAEPPRLVRKQPLNGTVKRAPGINGADADVHRDGPHWNEPSIERRRCPLSRDVELKFLPCHRLAQNIPELSFVSPYYYLGHSSEF